MVSIASHRRAMIARAGPQRGLGFQTLGALTSTQARTAPPLRTRRSCCCARSQSGPGLRGREGVRLCLTRTAAS